MPRERGGRMAGGAVRVWGLAYELRVLPPMQDVH